MGESHTSSRKYVLFDCLNIPQWSYSNVKVTLCVGVYLLDRWLDRSTPNSTSFSKDGLYDPISQLDIEL